MVLMEAVVVTGVIALLVYGTMLLLLRRPEPDRPPVPVPGRWQVVHRDEAGLTRVVLQKVAGPGGRVLDEHVIASIPVDDPDYDARFLTAMSLARERRALFEIEEDQ